jgi:ADP-ribose pyrophosphatase
VKASSVVAERDGWRTISATVEFTDAHLSVAREIVRTPHVRNGGAWTVVHRKPAIVVAPMLEDGSLLLIRQERIPIRAAIWEMPAGQIDQPQENDEEAIRTVALRELREESGYQLAATGELLSLGHFFSSPGFTDEHAFLFLARHVEPAPEGHAHTASESIVDCRSFTPREIARMIGNGEIRDANTLAVCARMIAAGLLSLYA